LNNRPVITALEKFLKLHDCSASQSLVAFSGGPDSTALLRGLVELHSALEPNSPAGRLHACWIDHGLRSSAELAAEEQYVRAFAERFHVLLHIRRAERGSLEAQALSLGSVEAAARQFRYAALREIKEAQGLRYILTGHHADDQRETQIMRFFSGSGAAGLRGMREVFGDIGRPFLALSRAQLESYLLERELPLNHDSTNAANDYLRNRLRHELMPAIASVFPGYGTGLNALAKKMRDDDLALEGYAAALFAAGGARQGLSLSRYKAAPRAVRRGRCSPWRTRRCGPCLPALPLPAGAYPGA
jgi:tRNA(Ile)-lysidine synthase